jgi:hypothetical protein
MRWILLGALLVFFPACGGDESSGGGDAAPAVKAEPKPDPAEIERKREEAEQKAEAAKATLRKEKVALTAEIAELTKTKESLTSKHEAESAGLPDPMKLRRTMSRLVQDAARKRSLYETDAERLEELEKEVRGSATAEIKELETGIAKKEKEFNAILSGAKAERANAELGIAEETEVQKEIRTLRAAKSRWFQATRETRRGVATARTAASREFKSWIAEDAVRGSVVAKALPKGKSVDGYDYSDLHFYLYLELLEDRLDRLNVAEEKKALSENEVRLVAIEKELDVLSEQLAEKMTEGGGSLEEYTDIKERLPSAKRNAENLERQLGQMRESFNDVEKITRRQDEEVEQVDTDLENKTARLKKVLRKLR